MPVHAKRPAPALGALATLVVLALPASSAAQAQSRAMLTSFTPDAIVVGQPTRLEWRVGDGTGTGTCTVVGLPSGSFSEPDLSGFRDLRPDAGLEVRVDCEKDAGADGQIQYAGAATLIVQSQPVAPTATATFAAPVMTHGQSVTFSWSSQYAETCSSPEDPRVSGTSGSFSVTPADYGDVVISVTCVGPGGTSPAASATVDVEARGKPQVVIFLGTGGTRLHSAAWPHRNIWVDVPGISVFNLNRTLLEHLELKPDPSGDPDAVVPARGAGVYIHPDSYLDDGLVGSGCLTNLFGDPTFPTCLFPYVGVRFGTTDPSVGFGIGPDLRARGIDFTALLYDWRLAWTQHYANIRETIDAAYARGQNEKVFVVGHSQGNPLFKAFITDNPEYRDKIAAFFAVAPVYLGTPTALESNVSVTGGIDFGMGVLGVKKTTGLRIGGHSPATYHMIPSRELASLIRHNTCHWPFEAHRLEGGAFRREFPLEDTLESAYSYLRGLTVSPTLFDRGDEIQQQLLDAYHGITTYQVLGTDLYQPGVWLQQDYAGNASVRPIAIPGDGTAPLAGSLGRYSGGDVRGSLVIPQTGDGDAHNALLSHPRTIDFVARAIFVDRGYGSDPTFGSDFPLLDDPQLLAKVGWKPLSEPSGCEEGGAAGAAKQSLPPDTLAFSTPDVDATLTLKVWRSSDGIARTYSVDKAGVVLTDPLPTDELGATAVDVMGRSSEPTLHATSKRLFSSGFDDGEGGAPVTDEVLASDLVSLALDIPLDADVIDVRISADRDVSGIVRLLGSRAGTFPSRIVPSAGLEPAQTLHYVRDLASTDGLGTLVREGDAPEELLWLDDTTTGLE